MSVLRSAALVLVACSAWACGKLEASPGKEADGASNAAPGGVAPATAPSPADPGPAPGPPEAGNDDERARACAAEPPPVLLRSAAGDQPGLIGSYCVDNARFGCGGCVDKFLLLERSLGSLVVAHPGDELTIAMPGAQLGSRRGCVPGCKLEVYIDRLVCLQGSWLPENRLGADRERELQRTAIEQDRPWTLAVEPGLYLLWVSGGEFSSLDGARGEATGYFGLLVDPERERGIVPAAPSFAGCIVGSDDAGEDDRSDFDAGLRPDAG